MPHFSIFEWLLVGFIIFAAALPKVKSSRKRKKGTTRGKASKSKSKSMTRNVSSQVRTDEEILSSSFQEMNGFEFERLLALYFRDQGYEVREVGVGGSDGGVDLVITDKRGEKTAVQAKCYSDHNSVPVQIVRELVGAKRNHDCILSLLVTTSDLTPPAKKEAEQFKVDYWHGALVEQKLKAWGKWQPQKGKRAKAVSRATSEMSKGRSQAAAGTTVVCICGAPMVQRKGREGKAFWGCSKFPACRHTKSL